ARAPAYDAPLLPPPPPRPYRSTLLDFIKSNRYFDGAFGKPNEAEDWLAQVERSFAAFEVPHHLRVTYGTYMMRFQARVWWESRSREMLQPITWKMFRQEFLENYFPSSHCVRYSANFLQLSQKGRPIEQYETEFSRLLQYAPESYRHSEELKRQVFLRGLDEDLRIRLEEFDLRTYRELIERAQIVDGARRRRNPTPEKKPFVYRKRQYDGPSSSFTQKKFKPSNNFRGGNNKKDDSKTVICWKCKKAHFPRRCPLLQNKCYFCGDPNHKVLDCPKKATTTCFTCKQTGHYANECPQKKSAFPRPATIFGGSTPARSGSSGPATRSASAMNGLRIYNLEGQWICEEDDAEEPELAALEEGDDEAVDYGLVTGLF